MAAQSGTAALLSCWHWQMIRSGTAVLNAYDVYIMQGHQVMITSLQAYNAMG
jgi:hypothetical protein